MTSRRNKIFSIFYSGPIAIPDDGGQQSFPPNRCAMRVAIINQKGGVGKTTTTVNLAGAFAELGLHVLAIDVDSQGDLSSVFLDGHEQLPHSLASLFGSAGVSAQDLIQRTEIRGQRSGSIDVIPADSRLNDVDQTNGYLAQPNVTAIGDALGELGEHESTRYQMVLMDCAPTSHLSTFSALAAADLILVPVEVETFAVRGLAQVQRDFARVQHFHQGAQIRYFLSKVPGASKAQATARTALTEILGGGILNTAVPMMAGFRTANKLRAPIVFARKKSKGADIMRALAREVLEIGAGKEMAA
jgi:chromosome partitioning protein